MVPYRNIRILIVDDSIIMRRLTKNFLVRMGVQHIVEAPDARKGLERLEEESIDLIISDWNMPGISGLSFLKAVKEKKKFEHIPFIMLTAEALKERISDALQSGVTKYILKPFTYDTFKRDMQEVFKDPV